VRIQLIRFDGQIRQLVVNTRLKTLSFARAMAVATCGEPRNVFVKNSCALRLVELVPREKALSEIS
jgi:hypothetical protein